MVVSLTLQLDEMAVVDMTPVKLPLPLAIPPPRDFDLPKEVRKMIEEKGITEEQLEAAQRDFERRCERDWYLEWFWFPYQQDVWVNTWSRPSHFLSSCEGNSDSHLQEFQYPIQT